MSFQQSLRPMLLWMRLIGVFLESPGSGEESSSPRFIRIWITFYGFLFFFANVFANGLHITEFFVEDIRFISAASLYKTAIETLNLASTTICSQLCLMSSAATKWPRLIQVLYRMERENCFESRDYQKFRHIFLRGFTSTMVLAVMIVVFMVTPMWTLAAWPVYKKIHYSFPPICLLFVFSGGALFFSLGWMASNMLDILAQQVYQANHSMAKVTAKNWFKRIDLWKHQHHLISQFIDEINHCFGPLLLVLITSGFAEMIVLSYNTMRNVSTSTSLIVIITNFLFFNIQFFFFLALIYVPHRIRESAVYFSKQLQCIELGSCVIENDYKIDLFVMKVLNSLPRITALGFFEVNLQLAPTLIGTTLTYLVILCQF